MRAKRADNFTELILEPKGPLNMKRTLYHEGALDINGAQISLEHVAGEKSRDLFSFFF